MAKKHWIGMAGLRGCIPSFCSVYLTKDDAIESLLFVHEDFESGKPRVKTILQKYEFAEIDLHKFGNEYLQVMPCDCKEPWVHDEESRPEDWQ